MSDAKIHLCFECGQKNRVPAGAEASALCGGCGKKLYPNLAPPKKSDEKTKLENSSNNDSNKGLLIWLIALIGAPILGIAIFFNSTRYSASDDAPGPSQPPSFSNSDWRPPPEPQPAASVAPVFEDLPETLIPGVLWNKTGRYEAAPFEIISRAGTNHIVKLVEATSGADAVAILVQGGRTIEVEVPFGIYRMKWCSGTTWYGEDNLFGPNQTCSTTSELFRFRENGMYTEGHTITLYQVADGNMDQKRLDPSAF